MTGQTTLAPATAVGHEQRFVERLRARDEAAFVELVRLHAPAMMRVARSYVGTRAVAEEVVQETWLAVLKSIDGFEERSSLRTWLFTILANCARRRGERERRTIPFTALGTGDVDPDDGRFLPQDHPRWPNAWASTVDSWDSLPEARFESRETIEVAKRAIDGLPAGQRAVISMRDLQGMGSAEVCQALAISEANQRVLLHRARTRVRRALEGYLDRTA